MQGTNELRLNEATMMEVVEYWLTNKVLRADQTAPKVVAVSRNGQYEDFVVKLSSGDPSQS